MEKEQQSLDSFFDQLGNRPERLDTLKGVLKKELTKQTLKKFPELRDLLKLDVQHMNSLHSTFHSDTILGGIEQGLIPDLEAVVFDDNYVVLDPPIRPS